MSVTTQERLDIIQAIIESIQDGVFIVDREGNYVNANSAFERITGINREEMVGKHTFYMIQKKWITKAVNLEVIKDLQYRSEMITYPSGKQILVTATPIMIRGGGFVGVVSSLRDVTELGRIQDDLLSSKRIIMDFKKKLESLEGKIAADQDSAVIAQSTEFRRAIFLARRVARSDATVLITGESGVGKDIIAKYIHEYSARKELGPFVKIDCASLPATLLESELFGYERGAFTNARAEGKKGMFEVASNGTMFLDEIGEIPLEIQSKLLNALQDRQIKRLGGTAAIAVDVRIVSATNVDLAKMVRERKFRQDLYYRLNVVPIHVKPLRERTQDVLPLIKHFLSLYTEQYHQKKNIVPEAMNCLLNYPWPGNVRELKNTIERIVVTSPGNVVSIQDIPEEIRKGRFEETVDRGGDKNHVIQLGPLKTIIEDFERDVIRTAMDRHGNLNDVARLLDIDLSTLTRKNKKYFLTGYTKKTAKG
ncbi:MAG TPA: sigma 54-interacting transcriptional regulator [Syntrophales bacterium]|nr:sigma 54-interacting transcriptional regulator [Syntrophales bacterium]HQQ27048.1 sigma 54-interacting transcriptional regulator [Syntrophales bacterium]